MIYIEAAQLAVLYLWAGMWLRNKSATAGVQSPGGSHSQMSGSGLSFPSSGLL